jgi:glutamate---cysteine ligase / carboxylate-amine ligase
LIYELLDFVDDVLDPLGSRHAVNYVPKILEQGTGADRQLKVYNETNSLISVVDYVQSQFLAGL